RGRRRRLGALRLEYDYRSVVGMEVLFGDALHVVPGDIPVLLKITRHMGHVAENHKDSSYKLRESTRSTNAVEHLDRKLLHCLSHLFLRHAVFLHLFKLGCEASFKTGGWK